MFYNHEKQFLSIARKVICTLIALAPLSNFGQDQSATFFDTFDLANLNLNSQQQTVVDNMKKEPIYKGFYGVKFPNLTKILKSNNGHLPIKLPGDKNTQIAKPVNFEYFSEDHYTWTGEFEKVYGHITIMCENGRTFGNLSVDRRCFEFSSFPDGTTIFYEFDVSVILAAQEPLPDTIIGPDPTIPPEGLSIVSILMVYTDYAAQTYPDIMQKISLCVSQMNQIINNSAISSSVSVVLAGTLSRNYSEPGGEPGPYLNWLENDQIVAAKRDSLSADLVVMLTGSQFKIIYEDGPDEGTDPDTLLIYGMAGEQHAIAWAFAATNQATYTFAHEVGHLFDCNHEVSSEDFGKPYAHPFAWTVGSESYRTLMHTGCDGYNNAQRMPNLSNPIVHFNDNILMGTSSANNNARAFVEAAPIVSEYRTGTLLSTVITGPSTGGSGYSYTWTSNTFGGTYPQTYQWAYRTDVDSAYQNCGNDISLTRQVPYGAQCLYLRFTVRDGDSHLAEDVHTVFIDQLNPSPLDFPKSVSSSSNLNPPGNLLNESSLFGQEPLTIYPNPGKGTCFIQYSVKDPCFLEISLTDLSGTTVKQILKGYQESGESVISVDLNSLSSGIYLCIMNTAGRRIAKKVIVY